MSTLLHRDPKSIFPDLVDWFEEPFLTLRPYLGQPRPVRVIRTCDPGKSCSATSWT